MKLNTNRIEALTDGIFAIVMTVMILSFSEIVGFKGIKENDFHAFFMGLKDDFLSYAVSFLILGILWFEHHWQFHYIKHTDPVVALLHVVWFMFVCIIPFSALLAGNNPSLFAPLLAFEINIAIVFAILCINWIYATTGHRLVDASLDKKTISGHRVAALTLVAVTLAVIGFSVLTGRHGV